MSRVVELLYSRRVPHVAALALMSFGFAGCSSDMQTRLSQNNLSNPFASQPDTTGGTPDWTAALSDPTVRLHLYGKAEPRAGRKMGHLTATAATAEEAIQRVQSARNRLRRVAC